MQSKINIKKYRLQSEMENLKLGSVDWFKDYIKQILESDKPYYEKADYIAYSINQVQNKLDYVSSEIKELQDLKKTLSTSKELAMEITASVLAEYGIEKLEGANISSITVTKATSKSKDVVIVKDEEAVMRLGFVSFTPDYEAIEKSIASDDGYINKELKQYIEINSVTTTKESKIKINNRKNVSTTVNKMDEILISEEPSNNKSDKQFSKKTAA